MKLIIDIPEEVKRNIDTFKEKKGGFYDCGGIVGRAIQNGTPLDDVKAEIEKLNPVDYGSMFSYESHNGARDMQGDILDILDNIGKAESEVKPNESNDTL